jgi:hypothetical protein
MLEHKTQLRSLDPCRSDATSACRRFSENDVRRWKSELQRESWSALPIRDVDRRHWSPLVVDALDLGLNDGAITIPTRAHDGSLRGVFCYASSGGASPRAMTGSLPALFPHPARLHSDWYVLIPDPVAAIAARSHGLPVIAVSANQPWDECRRWFAEASVTAVIDATEASRALADAASAALGDSIGAFAVAEIVRRRGPRDDFLAWLDDHPTLSTDGFAALFDPDH